jgi:hypothetical protein
MSVVGGSAWCELVTEQLRGQTLLDHAGYSVIQVGFEGADTRWTHASFLDGHLHRWASGAARACDLSVCLPAARWLDEEGDVGALLADVTFEAHGQRDTIVPADLRRRLAWLPRLPNATLDVLFSFTTGPLGPFELRYRVDDGRVALAIEPAASPTPPDIVLSLWFGPFLASLIGDRLTVHALERGTVRRGELAHLMLLAGLIESDPHRDAVRPLRPLYAALARHGDLLGAPALRAAGRAAAQEGS